MLCAALSWTQAARACEVDTDPRSLLLRLPALPIAFVGTVRTVHGTQVTWVVEQALRGPPGATFTAELPAEPCGQPFRPGERWFYGGASLRDPSRRLGDAALAIHRHWARSEDRRLGLAAWQACSDATQCVAIDHGCSLTAVHRDHVGAARPQAWARGGDPRERSCDRPPGVEPVLACIDRRCGAWLLTPTTTAR